MSELKYRIVLEPLSSGNEYYVNVYFFSHSNRAWNKHHGLSDLCLTYWGARYKAWWIKLRIENNWFKKKRTTETIYESKG